MVQSLLQSYVTRHNDGVRSGDFADMLSLFDDAAELHFINIPLGSFIGKSAIAEAFYSHPPDDELELLKAWEEGAKARAEHSWKSAPERKAGTIEITAGDGRIVRLMIHADTDGPD